MADVSARARPMLRYLLAFAGLTLCLLFAGLSRWQYGRGEEKALWLERVEQARTAPPRALAEALVDPPLTGLPVTVTADIELRPAPRLRLDNQQREGRVGLREYGLARIAGTEHAWLIVDLGWQPLPPDRQLPPLEDLPARIEALGLLTDLPGQGLRLAPNPRVAPDSDSVLLNYLDVDELSAQTGLDIAPRLLRLDPAVPVGHARDLDVLPNTLPPEKHRGYALQWAGLSVAALVITLLLYFRSRR